MIGREGNLLYYRLEKRDKIGRLFFGLEDTMYNVFLNKLLYKFSLKFNTIV